VDVSGNDCREMGSEAVKKAILSHSFNLGTRMCLQNLDISSNPLGVEGMKHVIEGISQSDTITTMDLSNCLIG
jgi:hypothetical protein